MKSKFLRILSFILVMSSLISMFAIFSSAAEADGNGSATEESGKTNFDLMYNRTFDEGWDILNGMKLVDQGDTGSTIFEIDYEETFEGKYNYFWRIELNSSDNDYLQLDCAKKDKVGAVIEFDDQNLTCYHYTMGQITPTTLFYNLHMERDNLFVKKVWHLYLVRLCYKNLGQ